MSELDNLIDMVENLEMEVQPAKDELADLRKKIERYEASREIYLEQISDMADDAAQSYTTIKEFRDVFEFHPRAAKLMRKRKNFLAVAIDEPYFSDVYGMIRENEKQKGTWTGEDEQLWRDALYRVGVDPDGSKP